MCINLYSRFFLYGSFVSILTNPDKAIKSAGIIGPIIINWSQLFMFSIYNQENLL